MAAGLRCGIKEDREDLAVIAAEKDAAMAVVTTRNQIAGAPVLRIRKILPRGCGKARAFVICSGISNVCTGPGGLRDAYKMAADAARGLGTEPEKVLVASTGALGCRLPMAKVSEGIAEAVAGLSTENDDITARAIMTGDSYPKSAVVVGRVGGRDITVAGIVKGTAMIQPSMATMIGAITTDLAIRPAALHKALKAAVETTFNAITVDSDTSTSDTVAVLASGAAGGKAITAASRGYGKFVDMLTEVCGRLAREIISDARKAGKFIEVAVVGARNAADAEIAAKAIANSPLVKGAIRAGVVNWGRIACALGKSAAKVDQDKVTLKLGGVTLFARGRPRNPDLAEAYRHVAGKDVRIDCNLGIGKGAFCALTCDLPQ